MPPEDPQPPKRPRGRPKGKPLTDAELAQRQGAAWKHGGRAATPLRRINHPCRRDLCPMSESNSGDGFPCGLKEQVDRAGGAMTTCLPDLFSHPELSVRFRRALDGDLEGLKDLTADVFSGLSAFHARELRNLLTESGGLTIEQEYFNKEGDSIGFRTVVNPAIEPFLKLNEQLGFTAAQQRVTPKSRGEADRDESFSSLVEFMTKTRQALSEGGKP